MSSSAVKDGSKMDQLACQASSEGTNSPVPNEEAEKKVKVDKDVTSKDFRRLSIAFVTVNVCFFLVSIVITHLQSPWAIEVAQVSNGYGAKISCSLNFLPNSNRSQSSIDTTELLFPPIIFLSKFSVDFENKCVTGTSRFSSSLTQTACFRNQQLGCVLLHSSAEAVSPSHSLWTPPPSGHADSEVANNDGENSSSLPWPYGDAEASANQLASALEGVNLTQINALVSAHLAHSKLHARAFLLIRDGVLIYEKYADNADASTPMIGWSCTKSITSTLLGIRSLQSGAFDLQTDVGSKNGYWINSDKRGLLDDRKNDENSNNASCGGDMSGPYFSVGRMLRMSDGLDFDESYNPGSNTTSMLFTSASTADIMQAPNRRAASSGRSCFQYSSLSTNLLQNFLKESFGGDTASYLNFPQNHLFNRIGVRSATMETDPTNTFVGSSFSYMNARDWAKLGLLWLNDGVWPSYPLVRNAGATSANCYTMSSGTSSGGKSSSGMSLFQGTRLLPKGWMDFARTPTSSSHGVYGAHFWLGGNDRVEEADPHALECDELFYTRIKPSKDWLRDSFPLGSGVFMAHGFEEQLVAMAPKKGLVMVRLGASKEVVIRWEKEKIALYRGVMDAIADKY